MNNRNESSLIAHEIIKPHKETHYKIIIDAIYELGHSASSKVIANNCVLDYHEVARRLPEMERLEKVEVVGRDYLTTKRPLLWDLTPSQRTLKDSEKQGETQQFSA